MTKPTKRQQAAFAVRLLWLGFRAWVYERLYVEERLWRRALSARDAAEFIIQDERPAGVPADAYLLIESVKPRIPLQYNDVVELSARTFGKTYREGAELLTMPILPEMLDEPGQLMKPHALIAGYCIRVAGLGPGAISSDWATVRLVYMRSVGPQERLKRWLGWHREVV